MTKEFRKNENELFICEECGITFFYKKGLSKHANKFHILKEYYDKWLKEENEGICKICGNVTDFINFKYGYKNCCCKNHTNLNAFNIIKIKNIEKYEVSSQFQRKEVKEKIKKTNLKKYKVEFPFQSEKIRERGKQTCLKKYGVETPWKSAKIRENGRQTCLKKYGNKNYNNIKKNKETCLKNIGVEHPSQNKNIFEKQQISAFKCKKYNDTDIFYRGSYELDFLKKYYNIYPDIINAPPIEYRFNNKNKIYHPDFFIPSLNLIIECKNSYLLKRDKNIINKKEKATINSGFNYIMIINKDYKKFIDFL